ncbi:hypothetical protein AXG93_4604s1040 [Marchantia polymorpha subsp. ruderalis]|uniref:Beta-fructofuranosidase n=1 Tax=Marchantia polymorpha subsp. ruderalis TaxID=1480154 RepID=A0A176VZK6_MARPO|nr:hypothetical protein AXG93_4604s1040 [Marchantia polymorpha subsp. ruderalis]
MGSTAEYAALNNRGGDAGDGELEFVPLVIRSSPSHEPVQDEVQKSSMKADEGQGDNQQIEWAQHKRQWKLPICIIGAVVIVVVSLVLGLVVSESKSDMEVYSTELYRTGFHFQPQKNWMNGMIKYMGYYHLFYQYNPDGPKWGNINWGHAVSKDLVHWHHINQSALAPGPDWYDIYGVWSGSSTLLPDGTPAILYTGWSNISTSTQAQTQNLAVPLNASDPLLRDWVKSPSNPIMNPGKGFNTQNFRDPTEGWIGADGQWRVLIGGTMLKGKGGTAHLYKSRNFVNWTYVQDLHSVNYTGMWECPDFYPVAMEGRDGLDVSTNTVKVKHVLKASTRNHDYYTVGTYDSVLDTFVADDPELEVGFGMRYDYGKFYASKSFFDKSTSRRILFGWVSESDSDADAITKGWSGLQSLPRQVWLDPDTGMDLVQAPVEEVDGLHRDQVFKFNFTLPAGSVMAIEGVHGPQLDIQLEFNKPDMPMNLLFNGTDATSLVGQEVCANGTSHNGLYGPFGVLVLAEKDLLEQTGVFFYLTLAYDGTWKAIVCSDESRSSMQTDVDKASYGTYVRVLESDQYLTLRTLVDHSIVETFAQGGRAVITSRVYPTMALNNDAYFFLFNNGTQDIKVQSLNAWRMEAAPPDEMEPKV